MGYLSPAEFEAQDVSSLKYPLNRGKLCPRFLRPGLLFLFDLATVYYFCSNKEMNHEHAGPH